MMCKERINKKKIFVAGFTLIEMMLSIVIMGFVLIAISGVFVLFQKSAATTSEYADAQQNARIAIDYVTGELRQAGSQTDLSRGQMAIVHAGPYQVAFNADIDNGRVIDGMGPLRCIDINSSPNTVPVSGSAIYSPTAEFDSDAETVVFTLDSSGDGLIDGSDRGDDPEENGLNTNLFVMKRAAYGCGAGGLNEMRESDLAIVRGPNLAPTWNIPEPIFQYYYNHDDDVGTPDRLWGDTDNDGSLDTAEILAVNDMPQNLLFSIQRVKITIMSESNTYDKKYETNGGFLNVTMNSEVYVRNIARTSSMIRGRVFHDADADGVIDLGETGIPGVEIRLAGQSLSAQTDNFGSYFFALPAGSYSVQEVDPIGYTSTTANLVSVTVSAGQGVEVNYGDKSTQPTGIIIGTVFEDLDKDGIMNGIEEGIERVHITLDSGVETYSNEKGVYAFTVDLGSYMVVETDPIGYSSTTPNSVKASITSDGDSVRVDFGDFAGAVTGTLEGHVFVDKNEDGVRDSGEEGLPNVKIRVSNGDSTTTNIDGYYIFNLEPDIYWVEETDHQGYVSTTVNKYADVVIVPDTTVTRDFGDVLELKQDFVEIHISNTERVLSVCTADLDEDGNNDIDIILGTALAVGFGNMLVFHNQIETFTTPVSELFDSDPSFWRDAKDDINTMATYDVSGDGVPDLITGLNTFVNPNIQIWNTQAGGVLPLVPDRLYSASGLNDVMDNHLAKLNDDGIGDLVLGLRNPVSGTGGFEVLLGDGAGGYVSNEYISTAGPFDEYVLGEVWAVETGDFDGDTDQDIVVGTHVTDTYGYIDVYRNLGIGMGKFQWHSRYLAFGAVNDIEMIDMMEENTGDPDLVVATTTAANSGLVLLYLNDAGTFGEPDTTGYFFGPDVVPNLPSDWVVAGGEALSLATVKLNNDVYPDVVYGTRSSILYTGDLYILPTYGTLSKSAIRINEAQHGEIISIDVTDFNWDKDPDIVVGTRSSATQGKLVAFFGQGL